MTRNTETAYRYRWVILGVLWTTYIVVFLNRLSVGPLAPFFKEELGITSAQVGMVMSASAAGYMITQFPVGGLVDRIGARLPIAIGEFIAGGCMIALFFAPSYIWLLVLMFVTGLGCGFLMPSTTQGVIIWFPLRERATVMGLKQTAVNIGGIISAATLPLIAIALGWRYGFLFLGIVAIAIGAMALILYKEPPRPDSSGSASTAEPAKTVPLFEILKNRDMWLVSMGGLCLVWVEFATMAHLVLYLTEEIRMDVVPAGGLLALAEAAGAIARPGGGFLSDRLYGGKRKPLLVALVVTACAMCVLLGLVGPYLSWVIYPVIFLLGMGAIGCAGLNLTLVSEVSGRYGIGRATGMAVTFGMAGNVLGPVTFGHIVDISGSYELAWLSLALMSALSAFLYFLVREEKKT